MLSFFYRAKVCVSPDVNSSGRLWLIPVGGSYRDSQENFCSLFAGKDAEIAGSPKLDVRQLGGRSLNHMDGLATCVRVGGGVCRSAAAHRLRINRMWGRGAFLSKPDPRPLLNPACFFESSSATRIRVYMNHGKEARVCSEGACVL